MSKKTIYYIPHHDLAVPGHLIRLDVSGRVSDGQDDMAYDITDKTGLIGDPDHLSWPRIDHIVEAADSTCGQFDNLDDALRYLELKYHAEIGRIQSLLRRTEAVRRKCLGHGVQE